MVTWTETVSCLSAQKGTKYKATNFVHATINPYAACCVVVTPVVGCELFREIHSAFLGPANILIGKIILIESFFEVSVTCCGSLNSLLAGFQLP